jgi:hypothetical protein
MTISYGETEHANSPSAFKVQVVLAEELGVSWQHASATCEFLGDMFASHCAKAGQDYAEARHSIIYLVNELLENAIKFRSPGDVAIAGSLDSGNFELTVTNSASPEVASGFQALLAEVTTRDPGDLLIERIEANAADENSSASGLGILTLMNDYGARLGWNFREDASGQTIILSTHATLTLN